METEKAFRLKTYVKYLLISPFSEHISLPNSRTILWIAIFISLFFRWMDALIIFLIMQVILYLFHEYKSGKAIYWLHMRDKRLAKWKETMNRIRLEKKQKRMEGMEGNEK